MKRKNITCVVCGFPVAADRYLAQWGVTEAYRQYLFHSRDLALRLCTRHFRERYLIMLTESLAWEIVT